MTQTNQQTNESEEPANRTPMSEDVDYEYNRTQIESAREGDNVVFNDRSYSVEVTEVEERPNSKHLRLEGTKGGVYTLDYNRRTGIMDFERISGDGRRLTVQHFTVVDREPRPFDRADEIKWAITVPRALATTVLSDHRESLFTTVSEPENGEKRKFAGYRVKPGQTERYRDLTVVLYELSQVDADTYRLTGPEVELFRDALLWAINSDESDFTAEEKEDLETVREQLDEELSEQGDVKLGVA